MKNTDPRDMTWAEIRDSLAGTRELIHAWLLAHGPATTMTIADALRMNLLSVRPRVSELCAWGFAECTGRAKHEGFYQAIPITAAQARHEESRRESQLSLML